MRTTNHRKDQDLDNDASRRVRMPPASPFATLEAALHSELIELMVAREEAAPAKVETPIDINVRGFLGELRDRVTPTLSDAAFRIVQVLSIHSDSLVSQTVLRECLLKEGMSGESMSSALKQLRSKDLVGYPLEGESTHGLSIMLSPLLRLAFRTEAAGQTVTTENVRACLVDSDQLWSLR